jgi:hypothetical protein
VQDSYLLLLVNAGPVHIEQTCLMRWIAEYLLFGPGVMKEGKYIPLADFKEMIVGGSVLVIDLIGTKELA